MQAVKESVESITTKRKSKLADPFPFRMTKKQFAVVKKISESTNESITDIVRDKLNLGLGLENDSVIENNEKIEIYQTAINELLKFFYDLTERGAIDMNDEDADRLNKIQEDL